MTTSKKEISVIIPTYNRCESVCRTVEALKEQTYSPGITEVIIVADGCTDNTVDIMSKYRTAFTLKIVEQANQGLAAARNKGATEAEGTLLVFLDDDVVPTPNLLEAHFKAHQKNNVDLVIGYYPPVLTNYSDYFEMGVWAAWENIFYPLRFPGHRFNYNDVSFGNSSIRSEFFKQTGGFNPEFRTYGREDWEYGIRLIKAEARFLFTSQAVAIHYPTVEPLRSLGHKRYEGKADIRLGRSYPELKRILPVSNLTKTGFFDSVIFSIAQKFPSTVDIFTSVMMRVLKILELLKLRLQWRILWEYLSDLWYCRGVLEEFGSKEGLMKYLEESLPLSDIEENIIEIDLSKGIKEAENQIDAQKSSGVNIKFSRHLVGFIPPKPGAEKLRGKHLRNILVNNLAISYLEALAIEGVINRAMNSMNIPYPDNFDVEAWIDELRGQKFWMDLNWGYANIWKWLSNKSKAFWRRNAKIKEKDMKKNWAEDRLFYFERLSSKYDFEIRENEKTISELASNISTLRKVS
ncbi:MAG: glycosyltransferase family 2 protein [Thermodesulfobacteriota bacterium]